MFTKKQFNFAIFALIALYILIFIARVVYDQITYEEPVFVDDYSLVATNSAPDGVNRVFGNIASMKKVYKGDTGADEILDQKYEQVASVSSRTSAYEDDLAKLDAAIAGSQAVVQIENVRGLEGGRRLSRVIGVKPQFFDECLKTVSDIGVLMSSTSQKIDKTYEYRQMLAEKEELEKRRESYVQMRDLGGTINELLSLEDKIIEVESMILRQSVDLGEYSDENAFCTINVTMYEGNPISFLRKMWNSFVWTNKCYFAIIGGFAAICLAAALFAAIYTYLKKKLTAQEKAKPEGDNSPQNNS